MANLDIIAFYNGEVIHPDGYLLDEILAEDDYWLEAKHTYIQWLFPLKEPSTAVPHSPIITDPEIELFRAEVKLKGKLKLSFQRMLKFYGFALAYDSDDHPVVVRTPDFEKRKAKWLIPQNHNYQRISRILKSLTLLGLPDMASIFFIALQEIYQEHPSVIGETTFDYWEQSIRG